MPHIKPCLSARSLQMTDKKIFTYMQVIHCANSSAYLDGPLTEPSVYSSCREPIPAASCRLSWWSYLQHTAEDGSTSSKKLRESAENVPGIHGHQPATQAKYIGDHVHKCKKHSIWNTREWHWVYCHRRSGHHEQLSNTLSMKPYTYC